MVEGERGEPAVRRCGFVALIGAPNVGKSTLINAIVGAKGAIVSHKVQTTRTLLRGIATDAAAQLVFIDTPGIFQPRRRLDRAMVAGAWTGAGDADIVAAMIDAQRGLDDETRALLERLGARAWSGRKSSSSTRSIWCKSRPCWRWSRTPPSAWRLPPPSWSRRSAATASRISSNGSP